MTDDRFETWLAAPDGLEKAAEIAIRDVLAIKERERVLIVTNPREQVYPIALALHDAAVRRGARAVVAVQQTKGQLDFAEDAIIGMMRTEPDVVISMTANKLGKDRFAITDPFEQGGKKFDNTFHYILHGKRVTRSFWSPSVTQEMFSKTVPIDYARLREDCMRVARVLDDAVEVLIVNENGTNFTIGLRGRSAMLDDGDYTRPGTGGNLPAGEAFISPELGTAEGVLVYDASISLAGGTIVLREPIRVELERGHITAIRGGTEAEQLLETIRAAEEQALAFEREGRLPPGTGTVYRKNARNLGELGIGLNPKAEVVGNMLEDEKAAQTCHLAIGSNYDEDAPALIHLDGLVSRPTITAFTSDGSKITFLKEGMLNL